MTPITEEMNSPLFDGIAKSDLRAVLSCTGYHIGTYQKGEIIALEGESIRHVGIILSGSVDMNKEDLWGEKTMLVRREQGELFGETFAGRTDQCAVVTFAASSDCRILFIPFYRIMYSCANSCVFHHQMITNMVRIIARKNRDLMIKVEVVSKKVLRDKILAYLSVQAQIQKKQYFEVPLGRVALAEYLCTDRSALTRELARMKADGLIDYDKNRFRIL